MSIMPCLERGGQVRHAQHRDLVDALESGEPGAVGGVADVVVGAHFDRGRGGRFAAAQRERALRRNRKRAGALGLLDGDELRLGLHLRDDVVRALAGRDVVEHLRLAAVLLDDQLEVVVARLRGVGDLDADLVAGRTAFERFDGVALRRVAAVGRRRHQLGARRLGAVTVAVSRSRRCGRHRRRHRR